MVSTTVGIAIIGSTGLALIETTMAAAMVSKHLQGESRPVGLIVAALGKAIITHMLL